MKGTEDETTTGVAHSTEGSARPSEDWMAEVRRAHRARVEAEQPDDARWTRLRARAEGGLGRRRGGLGVLAGLVAAAAVAIVAAVMWPGGTIGPGVLEGGAGGRTAEAEGGHRLRVAAGAALQVLEAGASRFRAEVTRGKVGFDVAPRQPGDLFRVDFAGHHLEVRGTAFEVEVGDEGEAIVSVHHGIVDVFRDHGPVDRLTQGETWHAGPMDLKPQVPPGEMTEPDSAPSTTGAAAADPVPASAPEALSEEPVAGPTLAGAENAPEDAPPIVTAESPEPAAAGRDPAPDPAPAAATRPATRSRPNVVVREVTVEAPGPVAVEPLSPSVQDALLASLLAGDCARAEKALAALVRAHGPATPGEVWWMRAWCARKGGDLERSRRWFKLASGRVDWTIPSGDELPPLPR